MIKPMDVEMLEFCINCTIFYYNIGSIQYKFIYDIRINLGNSLPIIKAFVIVPKHTIYNTSPENFKYLKHLSLNKQSWFSKHLINYV